MPPVDPLGTLEPGFVVRPFLPGVAIADRVVWVDAGPNDHVAERVECPTAEVARVG